MKAQFYISIIIFLIELYKFEVNKTRDNDHPGNYTSDCLIVS